LSEKRGEKCYRGDVHLSPLLFLILKKANSIKKKNKNKEKCTFSFEFTFFNIKRRRGDG
jgi:hypothetical protein